MTDGRLVIDFVPVVEFPAVAGIVVEGANFTRKINCGGPAWKDYQADWPPAENVSGKNRFLPVDDFYEDWAAVQFGPAVGPAGGRDLRQDRRLSAAAGGLGRRPRRDQARPAAVGRSGQAVRVRR